MTDPLSPGAAAGTGSVVGRLMLWASRTRQPGSGELNPSAGQRHLPEPAAGDAQWPGYPVDEYI